VESLLIDQAGVLGVSLTPEQASKLLAYELLLRDRAVPFGMVSRGDSETIRTRHVLDCLRAVGVVRTSDAFAFDLGSGAGLPGVVVAVACPNLRVELVEARNRRAAFLELVVSNLQLSNVRVKACRIEDLKELADICFARAVAPPARVWQLCKHLINRGGRLVYFAGRAYRGNDSSFPGGASRLVKTPALESSGPLVIISRQ
jgi:16S rRNA (guanine527-N7)-methyltransferase